MIKATVHLRVWRSDSQAIIYTDGKKILTWQLTPGDLVARGCEKVRDYLHTNPNVAGDRKLCDDVKAPFGLKAWLEYLAAEAKMLVE